MREPAQEQTAAVEGADTPGAETVSVDLPGLPVGGDDVELSSSAPAACVSVNWTAGTLRDGASVEIDAFGTPDQFVVSSEPCSSRPCLESALSASDPGCTVVVAWTGAPIDREVSQLSVTDATLTCADAALCRETLALIDTEGPATIGLLVTADEPVTSEDETGPPEGETAPPEDETGPPEDETGPPEDETVSPGVETS